MPRLLCLIVTLLLLAPGAAFAQSAVPIGYWTTDGDIERLLVEQNRNCSFMMVGGVQVAGECVWTSSSNGGILALYYQTANGLAPIYWNVLWVDARTITVNGDVFHRRQ